MLECLPSGTLTPETSGASTQGQDATFDASPLAGAAVMPPAARTFLHVLVVDDVSSNRKLLRRLLERSGHSCAEAENGQSAVDMIVQASDANTPFHSILLDFEMPIMDGPTAAKEIRRLGFDLNIIGITGNVLPDDVRFFQACGADDVLAKPIKMPDLYASWQESGIYALQQQSAPLEAKA